MASDVMDRTPPRRVSEQKTPRQTPFGAAVVR